MSKTYYVAVCGKEGNDGLSENSPLSLAMANKAVFHGGDRVLLKRGDVLYGELVPTVEEASDECRVEIGAYGEGAKPILSRAKIVSSPWTDAGDGFYKFDLTANGCYEGIRNDNANVGFMKDAKGNYYGRRFKTLEQCTQPYDIYCDETAIYVRSDEDPYAALGTLTMNTFGGGLALCGCLNIHDLHIQYCGWGMDWAPKFAEGRTPEKMKHIRIYDCVVDDVGGVVADVERHIRLGNCISLWQAGYDVTIENNLLRGAYDVAFTPQGFNPGDWDDIVMRNNIIAYNTQALETWSGSKLSGCGIRGMTFTDNLCIKNGEGWASHARPSQHCDVLTYGYPAEVWHMNIEHNTFYHSEDISAVCNIHPPTVEKFFNSVIMDHNHTYQLSENSNYLYNRANVGGPAEYAGLQLNLAAWQALTGLDKNSTVTYIGDNTKYAEMERIALTSLDFDEIARAAKAAGLSFTLTYDEDGAQ